MLSAVLWCMFAMFVPLTSSTYT